MWERRLSISFRLEYQNGFVLFLATIMLGEQMGYWDMLRMEQCEDVDESCEHLLFYCWSQPRQLFLKEIILKVRQAGIKQKRGNQLHLGDKSSLKLAFAEEGIVLKFLPNLAVSITRIM